MRHSRTPSVGLHEQPVYAKMFMRTDAFYRAEANQPVVFRNRVLQCPPELAAKSKHNLALLMSL